MHSPTGDNLLKLTALQYLPIELKIQSKLFNMIYKNHVICFLDTTFISSSSPLPFILASLTIFLALEQPYHSLPLNTAEEQLLLLPMLD